MRHSIWKATQLVHGTPRLAASQRTFRAWQVSHAREARCLLKLSCPAEVDAAVLGAGGVGVPVVDVWV